MLKQLTKFALFFLMISTHIMAQQQSEIQPAAAETKDYLPLLKNKKVALVVNQTSTIKQTHLVDSLQALGVNVVKVFAPEHGFRGEADAGEVIKNGIDQKSGLPIISLYGKNKKPTAQQLQNVDVILFDIQDVGVRFYTYISTMHYVMEAAAENNKSVVVLDRPNPNGMYVEGPVLDLAYQSFVGMHAIPIVHGLTVGELALMINGEGWLTNGQKCDLTVVSVKNYTHQTPYSLPIKPSPNLPNDLSIALYPSLCLFEGTVISVGRGTLRPFQQIGHPLLKEKYEDEFTPISMPGAKSPPFKNEDCYGISFTGKTFTNGFSLRYLIDFYAAFPQKDQFFNSFFTKLAGNKVLQEQIASGFTAEEIELSWQSNLNNYRTLRKKYLLYPD